MLANQDVVAITGKENGGMEIGLELAVAATLGTAYRLLPAGIHLVLTWPYVGSRTKSMAVLSRKL